MISPILYLCALCLVCASLRKDAERYVVEAERDLKNAAQHSCAKSPRYTTLHPSLLYADHPVASDGMDFVLSSFSAARAESNVVQARISQEEIKENINMPTTLTGTNIGLGVGLTGGKPGADLTINSSVQILYLLPLQHPRQNASLCVHLGQLAERGISSFYELMKPIYKLSHVTIVQNVMLHQEGMVALECGWLQPRMGCANRILRNGRIWRRNITKTIEATTHENEKHAWQSVHTLSKAFDPILPIYDEVFVIGALCDFNFYHFLSESLTRMVRFYHYLQRHPHIKIQIRLDEMVNYNVSDKIVVQRAEMGRAMRTRVLTLLEISPDRIVSGNLIARKLYLPNDIECASSPRHSLDLRLLSKLLVRKADKTIRSGHCSAPTSVQSQRSFASSQVLPTFSNRTTSHPAHAVDLPVQGAKVLIQARECKNDWRCLSETVAAEVARAAQGVFLHSDVVIANTSLSRGLACDIDLYRSADVVIGAHGAAMTNLMFMRPGTVLVEIVGAYDLRIPPVCGFYGPFAAVFGVHHFIYYYDNAMAGGRLDVPDLLSHVFQFYNAIRTKAQYTVYSYPFSK